MKEEEEEEEEEKKFNSLKTKVIDLSTLALSPSRGWRNLVEGTELVCFHGETSVISEDRNYILRYRNAGNGGRKSGAKKKRRKKKKEKKKKKKRDGENKTRNDVGADNLSQGEDPHASGRVRE